MVRDPSLIVLCGVSFSGKSTVAQRLAPEIGATVLSLDAINRERGLEGGQGIPVSKWAETNDIARERVRGLLRSGASVIVDDTSSPRFLRDRWRSTAAETASRFLLVWVRVDPQLQRRRVAANRDSPQRPDVVEAVLAAHLESFEQPTEHEHPLVVDSALDLNQQIRAIVLALAPEPT